MSWRLLCRTRKHSFSRSKCALWHCILSLEWVSPTQRVSCPNRRRCRNICVAVPSLPSPWPQSLLHACVSGCRAADRPPVGRFYTSCRWLQTAFRVLSAIAPKVSPAVPAPVHTPVCRSEEHTSELQSPDH